MAIKPKITWLGAQTRVEHMDHVEFMSVEDFLQALFEKSMQMGLPRLDEWTEHKLSSQAVVQYPAYVTLVVVVHGTDGPKEGMRRDRRSLTKYWPQMYAARLPG